MELQSISLGDRNGKTYLLQRDLWRVLEADQAMMDILGKAMPYKVFPPWSCRQGFMLMHWIYCHCFSGMLGRLVNIRDAAHNPYWQKVHVLGFSYASLLCTTSVQQ